MGRLKGFDCSSSDDDNEDEDAFSSLTSKKRPLPNKKDTIKHQDSANTGETSSNKRHHHLSAERKSKMDAMLSELQSSQPTDLTASSSNDRQEDYGFIDDEGYRPNKMGSYVEPGQEHLTTNIFVGNLDPCTTEEELTDVFREYGDLYSVKIMWPRTAEERARNRNTGFVCFMHRKDAEDAMDAYCDADPLETGRRMRLTWGKNVKKTVQFGTGGVPTRFRKKLRSGRKVEGLGLTSAQRSAMEADVSHSGDDKTYSDHETVADVEYQSIQKATPAEPIGPIYNPDQHAATAIIVNAPADPRRQRFISTIASFVAKDGSVLEQKLIERESHNPEFQFLLAGNNDGEVDERFSEHIYYRWRVYAFAQGDGPYSWRTTPFVMIQPNGRFWIPPRLDMEEACREEEAENRREESRMTAQEERRKIIDDKDLNHMTGRQIERATGKDKRGAIKLNDWEKETFHNLFRVKLCASQDSICEAMAFAFDKSGAAVEISELLKTALLESSNGISADTRIARLYLLSDILFNSQQPGVRNAFQYRDAIEAMSPEVFESLGKHGNGKAGRMTMNRLRNAVSSVLSAWTNWSVYNTNFLDLLECRFEGREYIAPKSQHDEKPDENDNNNPSDKSIEEISAEQEHAAVSTTPRGAWTASQPITSNNLDGEVIDDDIDGEALDGEPLDVVANDVARQSDVSTVPRGQWTSAENVDGDVLDEDIDGEELDDIDGEPLDDLDGDALDDDEVFN